MYGKNVKKTISKGKVYAQKFNQEDEKDNIIYLYNYEKNVDGKNWSKVEAKTKEKNVQKCLDNKSLNRETLRIEWLNYKDKLN